MNTIKFIALLIIYSIILIQYIDAGPSAYHACQIGCLNLVKTCYGVAGAVFDVVTAGSGTSAAILACDSAYGTCQGACWVAILTPTP